MFRKYKDKIKKHFYNVLEIKTSPSEIAIGFSIGTFFANVPTFGLEFLIIFLIIFIFNKISKISLIFAYALWNPLLTYPIAAISYLIGNNLLKDTPVRIVKLEFSNEIIKFTIRYFVGSLIVATILSIISFIVVYFIAKKYQKKEIPILQKPLELPIKIS